MTTTPIRSSPLVFFAAAERSAPGDTMSGSHLVDINLAFAKVQHKAEAAGTTAEVHLSDPHRCCPGKPSRVLCQIAPGDVTVDQMLFIEVASLQQLRGDSKFRLNILCCGHAINMMAVHLGGNRIEHERIIRTRRRKPDNSESHSIVIEPRSYHHGKRQAGDKSLRLSIHEYLHAPSTAVQQAPAASGIALPDV